MELQYADDEYCQRNVLSGFDNTASPHPEDKLIHQLFERQVRRTPNAIAVTCEGRALSFGELNSRANKLARYLVRLGVRPDDLVALCLERSSDVVVALLGILKAGGAYVPVDPAYPPERLAFLLKDAAPRVLLIHECFRERVVETRVAIIALDHEWALIGKEESADFGSNELGLRDDNLAYVIYTSGSTGEPKGVMIEHRHVVNLWQGLECAYGQSPVNQRVALNASLSFDASVQQFAQLLSGRNIFLIPERVRRDPLLLVSFVSQNQIDGIDCTPSQLKTWISAGILTTSCLRTVLVGGEAIDQALWVVLARCSDVKFYNAYGPTECTVDATLALIQSDYVEPHIGRPMANRRVYIVDSRGTNAPVGVGGEIYIGGAGLGRGYLKRPDLTAERFTVDPFSSNPGARLYRSGDLGRWQTDGTLQYQGRDDFQVKIRGFRVEPAEIEAALRSYEGVKHAVVVAREHELGGRRLVGYVLADLSSKELIPGLQRYLQDRLPPFMVPSALVALESLPLTTSGKLDRRALPEPVYGESDGGAHDLSEGPEGETEEELAVIWREVLRVDRVGRKDHFFGLGADSLAAMTLVVSVADRFSVRFHTEAVFRNPGFKEMARYIEELLDNNHSIEESGS